MYNIIMKTNGILAGLVRALFLAMIFAVAVVVVGLLDSPSDHDDSVLFDTEYARAWYASEGMVNKGGKNE